MSKLAMGLAGAMLCAAATWAVAAELQSGPSTGDFVGAFDVVKVGGAVGDGVTAGEELCYRCKYGNSPVVMVFARTADASLAKLTKKLDAEVAEHKDAKLRAFVNVLAADKSAAESAARELAAKQKVAHVAVVVPVDHQNGPTSYHLNPDADVTVLVYNSGKVLANYSLAAGGLSDAVIDSIVADAEKMLN